MKNIMLLLLVLVCAVLVSCTAEQPVTPADIPEEPSEPASEIPAVTEPEPPAPEPQVDETFDPEVEALLAKAENIENYKFNYKEIDVAADGVVNEVTSYEFYLRGNKVKKIYNDRIKIASDAYYNDVYLDLDAETAFGACSLKRTKCDDGYNKYVVLDFNEQDMPLDPLEVLNDIPSSATKTEEQQFDSRDVSLIEYESLGKTEVIFIDEYYGMPLKKEIRDGDNLVKEYRFTRIEINSIRDADVTVPEEYEEFIVE